MVLRKALERLRPQGQRPETPTTAIYFAHAMAHLIGNQNEAQIRRVEPNVFVRGKKLLIVRHWSGKTRQLLRDRPDLEVVYLIDDDIWELDGQAQLPSAYRARLGRLRSDFEAQLAPRLSRLISPSPRILERFNHTATCRIEPGLIYELPGLEHHGSSEQPFNIVFSATSSHLADLASVATEIARFLRGRTDVHLTTFLGGKAPVDLKLPNCSHQQPLSWEAFRATVPRFRFHAGIAPANPTSFNASRSATRVLDHAAFGAAGLYSEESGPAAAITDGKDGGHVGREQGAWAEALERLMANREHCLALAGAGQDRARLIGDLDRLRAFWCRELELPDG